MKRTLPLLAALAIAGACAEADPISPAASTPELARGASAAFPSAITITFGRDDKGTTYFPPGEHDASFHAKDKITPRVTHLSVGGTVTFDMGTFHGVAVYTPGTTPEDIVVSDATLKDVVVPFPPGILEDFIIDDPNNRLAMSDLSQAPMQWTVSGIFNQPGRYLVICYVTPHFTGAKMYAYIDVR